MSGDGQSVFVKHWRWWTGGSALAGIVSVSGLFLASGQIHPAVPAPANTPAAVSSVVHAEPSAAIGDDDVAGASAQVDAEDVAALAAKVAAEATAAARKYGATVAPDPRPIPVFTESVMDIQEGFWMDRYGECYGAYGKSPAAMAANVEEKVGRRISGYDWFDGGMIINFRNGDRIAVWPKLIDCKDPPFDPLAGKKR